MELIYSLILGTMNRCRWSCVLVFFLSDKEGRGWRGGGGRTRACECMNVSRVCVCMCECEILIVLTQALKISLHAEAPWFSRIHNACNTEELTDICILRYCILVYSCTCLKGIGHCTGMWHSYASVYTKRIYLFPCVLCLFLFFFFHPFQFLCKTCCLFFFLWPIC